MFTKVVSSLGLLAAAVAILAVLLERTLPDAEVSLRLQDLPKHLRDWESGGSYVKVADGHKMFYRKGGRCGDADSAETIILVHGFPTSSYDYERSRGFLEKDFCVVMFDHLGFGFSDKPAGPEYIYSIFTAAENALELWRQLKIHSAHIVAHDMGDSIVTEIVSRRQRNMLPSQISNDFFKSVTFTNGGMRYSLSNFRLSQTLLKTPIVGEVISSLMCKLPQEISSKLVQRQMASIWSPVYSDTERMQQDISDIEALIKLNGGKRLGHRTISYLHDRARFEPRWLKSLSQSEIPFMVLWGDADAVAPIEIAKSLGEEGHIGHKYLTGRTLKDVGHFLMLEAPEKWAKTIAEFVKKNTSKS